MDKRLILECLKKEAEFCIKEKFNEKNTRFYLGRETALTDIIRQIESGKFDVDPIPLPTIKYGDIVRSKRNTSMGEGKVLNSPIVWVEYSDDELMESVSDLEVSHD